MVCPHPLTCTVLRPPEPILLNTHTSNNARQTRSLLSWQARGTVDDPCEVMMGRVVVGLCATPSASRRGIGLARRGSKTSVKGGAMASMVMRKVTTSPDGYGSGVPANKGRDAAAAAADGDAGVGTRLLLLEETRPIERRERFEELEELEERSEGCRERFEGQELQEHSEADRFEEGQVLQGRSEGHKERSVEGQEPGERSAAMGSNVSMDVSGGHKYTCTVARSCIYLRQCLCFLVIYPAMLCCYVVLYQRYR